LSKLTKRAQRSANKHSDPGFFCRVSEQYTATTQGMKASIPKSYFAVSKREHHAAADVVARRHDRGLWRDQLQ
jgi:hypothetical protein